MRDTFSPVWLVVGVVAAALSGVGVVLAAPDGGGDTPWGGLMIAAPAVATFASVVALLGRTDDLLPRFMLRTVVYSAAVAAASAVTAGLVTLLPSTTAAIAASSKSDGWHYWFENGENPFLLVLLLGWGAGLLAGLLAFVVIVLPVLAFRRPRAFAEANMMSTERRDLERNRRAGIAIAFLLILVFAIPTLIVFGADEASADDVGELFADLGWTLRAPLDHLGELAWLLGLLLIPVAVWLLWYAWRTQRVDRARRSAAGIPLGRQADD